jgi:hypothetical protein
MQTLEIRGEDEVVGELTRGERLQIMLADDELEALDSWRFEKRMPSRAAAVRELLKRGLAAEGFIIARGGSKSKDFGVLGGADEKPAPGKGPARRRG